MTINLRKTGAVTLSLVFAGASGVFAGEGTKGVGTPILQIVSHLGPGDMGFPASAGDSSETVELVADLNGDGQCDLAVGAPYSDRGGEWSGEIFIVDGTLGKVLVDGLVGGRMANVGMKIGFAPARIHTPESAGALISGNRVFTLRSTKKGTSASFDVSDVALPAEFVADGQPYCVGDLNGDGLSDLAWMARSAETGACNLLLLNGNGADILGALRLSEGNIYAAQCSVLVGKSRDNPSRKLNSIVACTARSVFKVADDLDNVVWTVRLPAEAISVRLFPGIARKDTIHVVTTKSVQTLVERDGSEIGYTLFDSPYVGGLLAGLVVGDLNGDAFDEILIAGLSRTNPRLELLSTRDGTVLWQASEQALRNCGIRQLKSLAGPLSVESGGLLEFAAIARTDAKGKTEVLRCRLRVP